MCGHKDQMRSHMEVPSTGPGTLATVLLGRPSNVLFADVGPALLRASRGLRLKVHHGHRNKVGLSFPFHR